MSIRKQETYWADRATFRTDPEVRAALSMVKGRLVRACKLPFRGRKITEEAVFAALVLWADAQPVERLESELAAFVARLEALTDLAARRKTPDRPGNEGIGRLTEAKVTNPPRPRRAPGSKVDPKFGGEVL